MEDRFFKFSLLSKYPEISHGVSTRAYGNMTFSRGDREETVRNRVQFFKELDISLPRVIYPRLNHTSNITKVDGKDCGKGSESLENAITDTDGLVADEKDVYLMVTAADCFSIFSYDPVGQIVGLAHAGWRGIVGGIVGNLIYAMQNLGSDRENILIGVGPGICQKHFVVKDEVLSAFMVAYPAAVLSRNKDGYIDLRKAIGSDLRRNDIPSQNVEVSAVCPVCQNGVFGSHRAEGDRAPISAAVIGMKE